MSNTIVNVITVLVLAGLWLWRRHRRSSNKVAVQAYTIPEPTTKERQVSRKDSFGVTLDPTKFVRIMLNDPQTRDMVYNAIRLGPMNHTEILGAANLADAEGEQEWYTVFAGTSRQSQPGQEGFVLRNRRGDRVSLRLKRQEAKNHEAVSDPTKTVPATVEGNELLRKALYEGDAAAAQALLAMSGAQPIGELLPPQVQTTVQEDIDLPEESDSPFEDLTV